MHPTPDLDALLDLLTEEDAPALGAESPAAGTLRYARSRVTPQSPVQSDHIEPVAVQPGEGQHAPGRVRINYAEQGLQGRFRPVVVLERNPITRR